MMQRLVAKGIARSYIMSKKRRNKPGATGIIADCDVCGGFMFNAKCYMHMDVAYFTPDQVMFPYEAKKIFDRIVYELHYLNIENPHHFTLDLDQLDRTFEHRFLQSKSYSFPVTSVELEYMFDKLGFLWLHHDSPQCIIYLLDKLEALLNGERKNHIKKCTIVTAL